MKTFLCLLILSGTCLSAPNFEESQEASGAAASLANQVMMAERVAALPENLLIALNLEDQDPQEIEILARAHEAGACQLSSRGLRILKQAGYSPNQIGLIVTQQLCGELPKPQQFLKGVPGAIAGMIGQFKTEERPDGSVHIVGLGGLVDQEVERTGDGNWRQKGHLNTALPCAQTIHNLVTRKKTD